MYTESLFLFIINNFLSIRKVVNTTFERTKLQMAVYNNKIVRNDKGTKMSKGFESCIIIFFYLSHKSAF